ncbi:ATP-dependent Clp protease ATP-binding subunit [Patescibacteria group bacterium]|nr:ATP-dependent Clp protease ATP-binding subunit [Patescibacteria group bacterium]
MSEEQKNKTDIQFITCPVCAGIGKTGNDSACKNCLGAGVIAFYQGRFFYWNLILNVRAIKLRHLKKGLNLALNLLAYIIGLTGLMALIYWAYTVSQNMETLEVLSFWRVKSPLILTFWISLLADMFVIYRLSQEEAAKQKITKPKYNQTAKYNSPNNWSEFNKIKSKYKIEISSGFSFSALKIIEQAFNLADYAKHGQVRPIHLFFNLLKDSRVAGVFSRLNVDSAKLITKLKNQLLAIKAGAEPTQITPEIKEIFFQAYISALNSGQNMVEPIHCILPILAMDKNLSELLYDLEIDNDKINNVIQWFIISKRLADNYRLYRKASRFKPSNAMDRAYTAVATPILNHFAYDLTLAAKAGRLALCVGRENEIKAIFQALESGENGVLLSGQIGVGKNMIIGQIASLMVQEDVPKMLKDKRLLELDISRLLSGASATKAEERLLVIIDEVARAGNIILYINNIENLMGITSGDEESLELSEVLVSAINRHNLICLASVSQDNYVKYIENKPLGNIMAKVEVDEPDNNLAIQMLESKIGFYEAKFKVYFTYTSIAKAVELSAKYINDKYLPAKAVDILEAIAVKVSKSKGINSLVDVEDVAEIISQKTKIPLTKITEKESEVLLNLEEKIHSRMIGQDQAVTMVAASLRRARTELREQKRPIANFLFLGPTGVGKTELAKTIAQVYFGDEDYMIRIDMSEYQRAESLEKMIGSPNSVLGYLTEAVRKAPFSLILLDELEKAHPDILNLFLQVMDDGRLTDGAGRTIDFTNSIIIATSNIGAVYIQDQIKAGASFDLIKQSLMNDQLNKYIKPELINRFDGVVVFTPLALAEIESIAKLMLNKVKCLLEVKGIGLKYDEQAVKKLAKISFDPKFGARPLRRLIQEKIENQIANKVLAGSLKRRDIIVIDSEAGVSVEKGREL